MNKKNRIETLFATNDFETKVVSCGHLCKAYVYKFFQVLKSKIRLVWFVWSSHRKNRSEFYSKKILLCFFIFIVSSSGSAQNSLSERAEKIRDSIADLVHHHKQIDILDIYRIILGKNPRANKLEPGNKAGKFKVALASAGSFSVDTKLGLVLSANAGFYTDSEKETKISNVKISFSYNLSNQIVLPIITNIWTKKNKLNLLGDLRYLMFPERTYGLGGHTSVSENANLIDYSNITFREAVLKNVVKSFYLGPAYNFSWHWAVKEAGQADGAPSDFKKYGLTKTSVSSGLGIVALYDTRKNSINPTNAHYAYLSFCPNFKFLGSDDNYQSLIIDLRKYITAGETKNVFALWSYNWFTFNGHAPYLDLPSTGWDTYSNMGRGYRRSRFRGKNLLYLEAEYRFQMTRNGFLGGVVFTNAQSVTDWPDNRFRTVYPAVGTGLRFKLNKHSNTNLCVDYAFGIKGSRWIFFNLGEVF